MNKQRYSIYLYRISLFLFCLISFLFWSQAYPSHLHYQEQFQLFLFNGAYFMERALIPGGISFYLSDFLVQFFYYPWLGAILLTGLILLIQQLTRRLAKMLHADERIQFISYLPAIGCWVFLCDENALPGFVIALIFSLMGCLGYQWVSHQTKLRLLYIPLAMLIVYLLAGSAFFVFIGWVMINEFRLAWQQKEILHGIIRFVLIGLIGFLLTLLAPFVTAYPFETLIAGIGYYRFPQLIPDTMLPVLSITLLTPWFMYLLTVKGWVGKRAVFMYATTIGFIGISGIYWIFDEEKEEIMKYDYLSKTEQWHSIIKQAEVKAPTTPLSVVCLNLALAKTGQLGDRMFDFYQNGTAGLIPEFTRDYFSPMIASEVFFHLGMINTAQRFMFEANEAIPDYRKSVRAIKRLAETNLLNEEYAVAKKYLSLLQQTLFYKEWATQVLNQLTDETPVLANPDWKALKSFQYTTDFLFSDTEMESMLGKLIQHNPQNKIAFEYLLGYTLQKKDLNQFMLYYPLGKELNYTHIPQSYQEALIFMWTQQHPNFEGLPWSISQKTLTGVSEFAHIYMKDKNAEERLQEKYKNTYWYYLLFRN